MDLYVICDKSGKVYLRGEARNPGEVPFGPVRVPNIIATMIDWNNLEGALNHRWVLVFGSMLSGFEASTPPDDKEAEILWEAVIRACAEQVRAGEEETAEGVLRAYEVMRNDDLLLQPQIDGSYALVGRADVEPPYDEFGCQSDLFLVTRKSERFELIAAALADYLAS